MTEAKEILIALREVKTLLTALAERQTPKEHFDTLEVARLVRRAPYTVRTWCRKRRLRAEKRVGDGSWVVSLGEIERYEKEGLLPLPKSP
jgi:hypothetical protein